MNYDSKWKLKYKMFFFIKPNPFDIFYIEDNSQNIDECQFSSSSSASYLKNKENLACFCLFSLYWGPPVFR